LWVSYLLEQLGRPPLHSARCCQFPKAPLGGGQLGPLQRAQTRLDPTVAALLAAPAVDRLLADPEIPREIGSSGVQHQLAHRLGTDLVHRLKALRLSGN
jgi:hypothetical protein